MKLYSCDILRTEVRGRTVLRSTCRTSEALITTRQHILALHDFRLLLLYYACVDVLLLICLCGHWWTSSKQSFTSCSSRTTSFIIYNKPTRKQNRQMERQICVNPQLVKLCIACLWVCCNSSKSAPTSTKHYSFNEKDILLSMLSNTPICMVHKLEHTAHMTKLHCQ